MQQERPLEELINQVVRIIFDVNLRIYNIKFRESGKDDVYVYVLWFLCNKSNNFNQ